jgi:hypothetical protein
LRRHRNAPFGIAAGSPNFAQGESGNRFAMQDEAIRLSRTELSARGEQETLPTWAPYKWAFGDRAMEPEDAIAAGAGESDDRDLWGGFYYGYHPYAEHGYPASWDNASYGDMPMGYNDPLLDPAGDMWQYEMPVDAQPQVQQRGPWHAAFMRTAANGSIHPSRSGAGYGGGDHEFEEVGFEGHGHHGAA